MAEQDDFTFDEQDSDSEEWYEEEEAPKKKKKSGGSRSRTLLLLLLLVALAGGAYYYFMILPMDGPGPAAPPKAVVKMKKKPMSMPVKQKIIKPAPAPVEQTAGEEKAADGQATPGQVKEPVAAPAKMPVAPKPMQKGAEPAERPEKVAEKPAVVPAPVAPEQEERAPKKVFETPAPKQASSPGGAYTLTAGTYLLESSVRSVSKKIRSLGYEPTLTPVKRKVAMTRLKVGSYPLAEAASKKSELKSIAPGVFGIRKGNMETVYAGSFLVLDKARRFADQLFVKGVKVEEEAAQVEKTLQRITFGSFATTDAARDAGRQAAGKGVEAKVVKNR